MTWRIAAVAGLVLITAGCSASASSTPPPPSHATATPRATSRPTVLRQTGGRTALDALAALPVKGRAPLTGYSRDRFGQAWSDDNDDPDGHNGCDTRNDILRRDLTHRVIEPGTHGCVVESGALRDPYTGSRIAFRRGVTTSAAVQIDHVVALGDAWQTGAQQLSSQARLDLANDPLELLAVDGPSNEAKGDGDAASWLPPNKAFRCDYVARQIAVKREYHLSVTAAESAAMHGILSSGSCQGEALPSERDAPGISAPLHARPSASSGAPPTCTHTASGDCIQGNEFCPGASYGHAGYDADGRRYFCTGDRTHPQWTLP